MLKRYRLRAVCDGSSFALFDHNGKEVGFARPSESGRSYNIYLRGYGVIIENGSVSTGDGTSGSVGRTATVIQRENGKWYLREGEMLMIPEGRSIPEGGPYESAESAVVGIAEQRLP